jgi:hypothetical protein
MVSAEQGADGDASGVDGDDRDAAAFRTKRGRCTVDAAAGAIRIEGGALGYLRTLWDGNRAAFAVALGALLALPAAMLLGDPLRLLVGLGLALGVVGATTAVQRFRGHTAADSIPLADVERVVAHPGGRLVRPRFVVRYIEDGSLKRRTIGMPSRWLSFAEEAYRDGKLAFANADLPVEER